MALALSGALQALVHQGAHHCKRRVITVPPSLAPLHAPRHRPGTHAPRPRSLIVFTTHDVAAQCTSAPVVGHIRSPQGQVSEGSSHVALSMPAYCVAGDELCAAYARLNCWRQRWHRGGDRVSCAQTQPRVHASCRGLAVMPACGWGNSPVSLDGASSLVHLSTCHSVLRIS